MPPQPAFLGPSAQETPLPCQALLKASCPSFKTQPLPNLRPSRSFADFRFHAPPHFEDADCFHLFHVKAAVCCLVVLRGHASAQSTHFREGERRTAEVLGLNRRGRDLTAWARTQTSRLSATLKKKKKPLWKLTRIYRYSVTVTWLHRRPDIQIPFPHVS